MKKLGSEHTEVAESYINLGLVHRQLDIYLKFT